MITFMTFDEGLNGCGHSGRRRRRGRHHLSLANYRRTRSKADRAPLSRSCSRQVSAGDGATGQSFASAGLAAGSTTTKRKGRNCRSI